MSTKPLSLLPLPDIRFGYLPQWSTYNPQLLESFHNLKQAPQTRHSHFFAGRYENIYIPRQQIPGIVPLLRRAEAYATSILAFRYPSSISRMT